MWPDTQHKDWRSNGHVTVYGIAGFRVSKLVGLQVFTVRFKKRKTDEMIKSYRRPDYTKQAYGLCRCICLPYKVSNQINILTEHTHTHTHTHTQTDRHTDRQTDTHSLSLSLSLSLSCHLPPNVSFCSTTPTFRQHIFVD